MRRQPTSMIGSHYESVGVHFRSPRVAVVFDGGSDWQFGVRSAMQHVSHCWGGAGFVLVPHHAGVVDPVILHAVQAYDPDFVVTAGQSRRAADLTTPGAIRTTTVGDEVSADAVTARTSSGAGVSLATVDARDWLAKRCTPYVRLNGQDWDEDQQQLGSSQIPSLTEVGVGPSVCLAAPPEWGGSVTTAAAGRLGVLEEPQLTTSAPDDAAVLAMLLDVGYSPPPAALVHSPTGLTMSLRVREQPTALDATTKGLVRTWLPGNESPIWVVGSGADDFALAMILDRLHGSATWIDPGWAADTSGALADVVRIATFSVSQAQRHPEIRTATMPPGELGHWLLATGFPTTSSASPSDGSKRKRARFGYSVAGQHDRRELLPLAREPDGTVEVLTAAPFPVVDPTCPVDLSEVATQVDLIVDPTEMPTCRGLDAHSLAGDRDEERFHTWIRSSKTGPSYQSLRFDFVSSGATRYGRLASPRLRVFGLRRWIDQMADQSGYNARASDAGRRTDLLAQLWGGRRTMAAAIASPVREALSFFTPLKQSKDSYLDEQAVRIANDRGVVTFDGIRSAWPSETSDLEVRQVLDELTNRRIVRRGILLRCPECLRLDFFATEQLAQTMECALCGADVTLVQANWHHPPQEPRWFYDAHPTARQLISTNSDVPLLLAAHLQQRARRFAHVGEIELSQGGKARAETDLVALADDQLMVAEAKSNTDLGAGGGLQKAIAKRILGAQVLRADQIILATTKAKWPEKTVELLCNSITSTIWVDQPPSVRLVTGLRTDSVVDEIC